MNLRQLEYLVALAEEASFARAAQRVHLSQSALSRSIQAIEDELGLALFDRTTREVSITPAGQTLVQRAKKVLFEARCMMRDADLLKNHEIGSVSIGTGPYPAALLLPLAIDELTQRHPQLRMNVMVESWKTLLELLYDESLDFLIVDIRGAPVTSDLDVMPLPKLAAAWFVREGHPLAHRETVDIRELHDYPIISVPLPDAMRQSLHKWFRFAPSQELEFHLVCNDVNILQQHARKTNALLLLSPHLNAVDPTRMAGLVPVSVPSRSPLWLQFAIVRLAGRTPSPATQQAIAAIQHAAAAG